MLNAARYTGGNALLDWLPAKGLAPLRPDLETVDLKMSQVLYPGGSEQEVEHVYFPIDAVTSMLTLMTDGSAVEAGTVGHEGVVGAQSAFGSGRILERWISQVPGLSVRMPARKFRAHFETNPSLRLLVHRYMHSYMTFLAQSAACNRLHVLVERCARWLLLTHDRVGRDDFPLTHEFLAMMLGVRRPAVSVAAATLQSAGFITYSRGNVHVADRAGLESASCECYGVTTQEYNRIFAEPVRQNGGAGSAVPPDGHATS